MARGPKKHLKRIRTPKGWLLDKLTGVYAPRPRTGPHKLRECLPLQIILRNRLNLAFNGMECKRILNDKDNEVCVDGKVRRDLKYPVGLMDVLTIEKTKDRFRMLYDLKGRFKLTKINKEQAKFKLCKVRRRVMGENKCPYIITHDSRCIRFPHPDIHEFDTVKVNLETGEIEKHIKFEIGNVVFVSGGRNRGRVGVIQNRIKYDGSFDIINIRDTKDNSFNTRIDNCFIIGKGKTPMITLPKGNGVRNTILEDQALRFRQN